MVRHKGNLTVTTMILVCTLWILIVTGGCDAIVGGKLVSPQNVLPWIVSIRVDGRHQCGGSLIAPHWLITAGHCGDDNEFNSRNNGDQNTVSHRPVSKRVTIFIAGLQAEVPIHRPRIYVHPEFSKVTLQHDIALWHLEFPIQLNGWPGLDSSNDSYPGWIGMAFGWGSDWQFGSMSHNLHKVALPILAKGACLAALGESFFGPGMICAGGLENQDTCTGDSGGPLVLVPSSDSDISTLTTLVGIVSWGLQCGVNGYPGIYTSVSEHIPWIRKVIMEAT